MPHPAALIPLMLGMKMLSAQGQQQQAQQQTQSKQQELLAKESRNRWHSTFLTADPEQQKRMIENMPQGMNSRMYSDMAGFEDPTERRSREHAQRMEQAQKGLFGILTGQPLMRQQITQPPPIQETDLLSGIQTAVPSAAPPRVTEKHVIDPRTAVGVSPKGLTGTLAPPEPEEPVDLQLKSKLTIEGGIVYEQDYNYNKEEGTLTPLGEKRVSAKNIEAVPNIQVAGVDAEGVKIFMPTRLSQEGTVNLQYADGTPFSGKLLEVEKRLAPEAQKFIDDLGDIEENVKGIEDFMSLIEGPDGKLVIKKGKKGKVIFDKSLTGPFQGRFRNFMSWFRNDPRFVAFKQKSARLRAIVYGLSGKQINRTELEWLKNEILPRFTQPDENYIAVLYEVLDWVKQKRKRSMKSYESMGYIVGGEPDEDLQGTVGDLLGVDTDDLAQFFTQ